MPAAEPVSRRQYCHPIDPTLPPFHVQACSPHSSASERQLSRELSSELCSADLTAAAAAAAAAVLISGDSAGARAAGATLAAFLPAVASLTVTNTLLGASKLVLPESVEEEEPQDEPLAHAAVSLVAGPLTLVFGLRAPAGAALLSALHGFASDVALQLALLQKAAAEVRQSGRALRLRLQPLVGAWRLLPAIRRPIRSLTQAQMPHTACIPVPTPSGTVGGLRCHLTAAAALRQPARKQQPACGLGCGGASQRPSDTQPSLHPLHHT